MRILILGGTGAIDYMIENLITVRYVKLFL